MRRRWRTCCVSKHVQAELLAEEADGGMSSLVCGDFNVVRSQADIKNWKPNHNKRGRPR